MLTCPVNQQILPSILVRLIQFPGRYSSKLVIPIILFPINLHFMGVLALFHLNPVWDFCYPVCGFSNIFSINGGYRMHSREGIHLMETLVFKALPNISKCGCWIAKCLTASENPQSHSSVPMRGFPVASMDSRFISVRHLPPFSMSIRFTSQSRTLQQLYAHKEKLQLLTFQLQL